MQPLSETDAKAWVQKNLAGWPKRSQALATQLLAKYGAPNDVTSRQLAWYDNAPWTRTVLHREEAPHNFPAPHKDVLEQAVSYRVPVEKIKDVLQYNGSVIIDRTRGEIAAHCESEMANIIVLNLVNDIVTDNRDLSRAQIYHAQLIRGIQTGDMDPYATDLRFKPAKDSSADPGEIAPLLKHLQSD